MASASTKYTCEYFENSPALAAGYPILLKAYALHRNETDENCVLQCSFTNIRPSTLVDLYIRVSFFDAETIGTMGVIDEFCYYKCYAEPYEPFGEETAIYLPYETKNVSIEFLAAVYQDGYFYSESGTLFRKIAPPKPFDLKSPELKAQFLQDDQTYQNADPLGDNIFISEDYSDHRICCCGEISIPDAVTCGKCGRNFLLTRGLQNETYLSKRNEELQDRKEYLAERHRLQIIRWNKIKKVVITSTLKAAVALAILYAVCFSFKLLWNKVVLPSIRYNEGITAIKNDDYVNAVKILRAISGFRDSDEKLTEYQENRYSVGKSYVDAGDYNAAIQVFTDMTDYRDSKEILSSIQDKVLQDALLEQALRAITDDDYASALACYGGLKDNEIFYEKYTEYRQSRYNRAAELFENEYPTESADLLRSMTDFPDAKKLLKEIEYQNDQSYQYHMAENYLKNGDYLNAILTFRQIGDYKDSSQREQDLLTERRISISMSMGEDDYNTAVNVLDSIPPDSAADFLKKMSRQDVITFLRAIDKDTMLKYLKWLDDLDLSLETAVIGDVIPFGKFEQDNSGKDGKEAIEWIVLDQKEGYVLLLSRSILKYNAFASRDNNSWENSLVREWLNGSFYNDSFSEEEKGRIRQQWMRSAQNFMYPRAFSTTPWNDTYDKVFLLSLEDVTAYRDLFLDTKSTTSALTGNIKYKSSWWLINRGRDNNTAAGMVENEPQYIGFDKQLELGVRPAIWIRMKP